MGMGDVKLALLLGVAVGRNVPVALLVGMTVRARPVSGALRAPRSRGAQDGDPFAPFLAVGGVVALFAGHAIVDWYLSSHVAQGAADGADNSFEGYERRSSNPAGHDCAGGGFDRRVADAVRQTAVNEIAELIADLLEPTGLVPLDRLAASARPDRHRLVRPGAPRRGPRLRRGRRTRPRRALQLPFVDILAETISPEAVDADSAGGAPAGRRAPLRARRPDASRRDRRSRQRRRRSTSCGSPPAMRSSSRSRRWKDLPARSRVSAARAQTLESASVRSSGAIERRRGGRRPRGRRPRGRRRRLRRAARPARQLAHLPGSRGRGQRRARRAAGGLPARPLPDRRRAPGGAADPEAALERRHDAPEGAREARHRRAAQAAGRPHLAERGRGGPPARHPRRDAADGRRRVGRDAPARQVEARADARGARPLASEMQLKLRELVHRPTGALLVTGPTGSGKTTTLYAALTEINRPEINIITVEDPVEYRLAGVNQVQINHEGRADVRDRAPVDPSLRPGRRDGRRDPRRRDGQDLDRGGSHRPPRALDAAHERRAEHAHAAERDGRRAVPRRLRRLGRARPATRPQALLALLRALLARRSRSCCRPASRPTSPRASDGVGFYRKRGCPRCNQTGYRGRIGIYQLLTMTEELESLAVAEGKPRGDRARGAPRRHADALGRRAREGRRRADLDRRARPRRLGLAATSP